VFCYSLGRAGATDKSGDVVMGIGDKSPPAGSRDRAPGGREDGKAPKRDAVADTSEAEKFSLIKKNLDKFLK